MSGGAARLLFRMPTWLGAILVTEFLVPFVTTRSLRIGRGSVGTFSSKHLALYLEYFGLQRSRAYDKKQQGMLVTVNPTSGCWIVSQSLRVLKLDERYRLCFSGEHCTTLLVALLRLTLIPIAKQYTDTNTIP